jgi:hypothetical protein
MAAATDTRTFSLRGANTLTLTITVAVPDEYGPVLDNEGFGPLVSVEATFTTAPMADGYGISKASLWDGDNILGAGCHVYDADGTHIGDVYVDDTHWRYGSNHLHAEYVSAHDGDTYVANADCRTLREAVHQIVGARRMSSYYCCEDARYRRPCTCR